MHPGGSIPNVGRRARGHRDSTFTLKGNGVSKTTTTTTTTTKPTTATNKLQHRSAETDDVFNKNVDDNTKISDIRGKCAKQEGVCVNGGDGDGEESFTISYQLGPHHYHHQQPLYPHNGPYVRIPHRVARSRQINKEDRHPNHTEQYQQDGHSQSSPRVCNINDRHLSNPKEMCEQNDHIQSSPRATTRTNRKVANFNEQRKDEHVQPSPRTQNRPNQKFPNSHQNRPSRSRAQRRRNEQQTPPSPFRWQGSRVVRRAQSLEEQTQRLLLRQKRSEKRSKVDLSGGCLTGRNPAGDPEGEDTLPEMPDTTRSDPGDMFRVNGVVRNLPQVVRKNTEPLDELLDYFWVYQGMGRQVLNLDLPREVWEKKLFRKAALIPPISISKAHTSTAREGDDGGLLQTGQDTQCSKKTPACRRALSEPPSLNSPRCPFPGVPDEKTKNSQDKSIKAVTAMLRRPFNQESVRAVPL
ncbi:hypothetical protein ACOMHN_002569 [Nucella lapillus]